MQDAREKLKAWQHDYNHHRPHGSLRPPDPERVHQKRGQHNSWEAVRLQFRSDRIWGRRQNGLRIKPIPAHGSGPTPTLDPRPFRRLRHEQRVPPGVYAIIRDATSSSFTQSVVLQV